MSRNTSNLERSLIVALRMLLVIVPTACVAASTGSPPQVRKPREVLLPGQITVGRTDIASVTIKEGSDAVADVSASGLDGGSSAQLARIANDGDVKLILLPEKYSIRVSRIADASPQECIVYDLSAAAGHRYSIYTQIKQVGFRRIPPRQLVSVWTTACAIRDDTEERDLQVGGASMLIFKLTDSAGLPNPDTVPALELPRNDR